MFGHFLAFEVASNCTAGRGDKIITAKKNQFGMNLNVESQYLYCDIIIRRDTFDSEKGLEYKSKYS